MGFAAFCRAVVPLYLSFMNSAKSTERAVECNSSNKLAVNLLEAETGFSLSNDSNSQSTDGANRSFLVRENILFFCDF